MLVIPRYEPVFVEPSVKEYETQVLQMSVPPGNLLMEYIVTSNLFLGFLMLLILFTTVNMIMRQMRYKLI